MSRLVFCAGMAMLLGARLSAGDLEALDLALPDLKIPVWNRSLTLRAGAGYKDNLLLNNAQQEESPFFVTGLDLFLFRLPERGRQFHFFLSADDYRYLSSSKVPKEELVAANAQFKKDFGNGWQSAVTLQYVFQDEVFDASLTETNLGSVKVQGHTATVKPWLGRFFASGLRAEMELPVTRQYFLRPLDDYWESGPKFTLGYAIGARADVALTYSYTRRFYDTRAQTDSEGRGRSGSSLNFKQQEVGLAWRQFWDPGRTWRTQTRIDFAQNRDNSAGYFDYDRARLSEEVRWQTRRWEVRAYGRASRYNYLIQKAAASGSVLRERTALGAGGRVERQLGKHWKLFATYDYERTVGNQLFDSYDLNEVSAGAEWEF